MAKRKSLIAMISLAIVMFLAIGYAAVTTTLTINGTSTAQPGTLDVYFTNAQVTTNAASLTAEAALDTGAKPTSATFSGTFTAKDQVLVYTFTVANDSVEYNATLSATVNPESNENFTCVVGTMPTVNSEGTATFTVTVTYIKAVTDTVDVNWTITITATGVPKA